MEHGYQYLWIRVYDRILESAHEREKYKTSIIITSIVKTNYIHWMDVRERVVVLIFSNVLQLWELTGGAEGWKNDQVGGK